MTKHTPVMEAYTISDDGDGWVIGWREKPLTPLQALERFAQESEDNRDVPQYIYDAIKKARGR